MSQQAPPRHRSPDPPASARPELDRRLCLAARSRYPRSPTPRSAPISRPRTPGSSSSWRRCGRRSSTACRAQGADQGRRPLGAGARGRLRVSLAVLHGRPVPDLVPPGARCRDRSSSSTRSSSPRQGLLQPARPGRQPRRQAARLHHRRGRLRALPAALRDLDTGHELADLVVNTSGSVEWAEDGRTLLYVELNDKLRPYRVRAHRLGATGQRCRPLRGGRPGLLRLDRQDAQRRFLLIATGTHVTREVHLLDARRPARRCAWSPRAATAIATASTTPMAACGS